MNSKHFFFGVLAVAGLAFVSCQSQETDFVDQPEMGDAPEFYAAIEQPSDTKVYADESLMVLWHADDRVSIFNKYTYNNQYAFQGETGANAGVFKKVPSDDFVTGNALPAIYAIYPYAEGTTISNSCEISLTLPSEQPYAELNFGRGANTMVSATEDNDLLFKNLCGYLAVKLYGDDVSVASVSLKGNNGEKLAGKAFVDAPLDDDPTIIFPGDVGKEIRVSCETPVVLGATAENYTEFWFVVPPTTFREGFTLTVTDPSGNSFEKSTTKEITIERNHLVRMSPFEVEIERQPDNEIWYTTVDGEVITPYKSYGFGANIVSNVYQDGRGVLTFDNAVTAIKNYTLKGCTNLSTIQLPESVSTIGEGAFSDCSNLTSFDFPSGITALNNYLFNNCSNLSSIVIPQGIERIGHAAFNYCYALSSVVLPQGLKEVGSYAFNACSFTSIDLPESLEQIEYGAFANSQLTTVTIPDSVTQIEEWAFINGRSLQSFSGKFASQDGLLLIVDGNIISCAMGALYDYPEYAIPKGVRRIGDSAFSGCINTQFTFPESLEEIGSAAFYCAYSQKSVILPSGMKSIGSQAFEYSHALKSITIPAPVPPTGGRAMFDNTMLQAIYVPERSVEVYKEAEYWSDYADRIEALPVHHSAITGATDLSAAQANCFVITAPGAYKFPALKGESTEAVGDVYGAELLWESCNNASEVTLNSVIAEVDYEDNWIYFQTPATLKSGNAVIAAMDYFGNIIWSWHIWIPATTITSNTHGIYNHELMDRNLGALVAAAVGSPAPVESFGLTYQWGRKDPFPGPATTSGYEPAAVAGTPISTTEGVGAGDESKISLQQSIQNPTLLGHSQNGDWLLSTDNTLWQNDEKTIYDPCPAGYRVPATDPDQPLMSSDWSTVAGWEESVDNAYFCMGNPAAVFPCGGYRDDYDVFEFTRVGKRVELWTAQNREDMAGYALRYRNPNAGDMHTLRYVPKARVAYIRCCKVEEAPAVVPVSPEAVDLGLSVKWASFNVGASAPEGVGNHYAWGETEPKESYTWENYKWWTGSYDVMSKYNPTDGLYALEMEDDVAAVDWGDKWRMPTHKEQEELYNNCDKTLTALNGVSGYRMTSRKNGNSIFLPLDPNVDPDFPMTFYSSRTLSSSGYACSVGMSETGSPYSGYGNARSSGWLIRPVYGDIVPVQSITLDKDAISLAVGDWARIYVSFVPSNASEQNVLWSSSDPTVAPVDQYGQIQPVAAGTATITAKSVDSGRTATCVVTVTPAPEAVDLGLSVKWASFNLGATAPEEYGDYFAWGETAPKEKYDWQTYKWCDGSETTFSKYNNNSLYGTVDNKTVLDLEDDAAYVNLGGSWRMPTEAEWTELRNQCAWNWTTQNGVNGYQVVASNGNSIFLPAAGNRYSLYSGSEGTKGDYWSSSLYTDAPSQSCHIEFNSGNIDMLCIWRYDGLSIRPVTD